jgi:copper transport protein
MAAACVVVVTGVVQSVRQLDTWAEITDTDFGRTLMVKVGLVVVVLALAAVSRRSVPSQHTRLGRTVAAEIAATLLILVVTGFLAGASPVTAVQDATGAPSLPSESLPGGAAQVELGDRVASVAVAPGTTGSNEIDVSVFNRVDRGELPDEITIEIAPSDGSVGAIDVAVESISQSRVIARAAVFTFPGAWTVTVRARYGEFESVAFTAVVTIIP